MGKLININSVFKKDEFEDRGSYESYQKNGKLNPIIDIKTQELMGYSIKFPIPNHLFKSEYPSNVIPLRPTKKNLIKIRNYGSDIYSGNFILNSNKSFLGVVYDENSPCYEYDSTNLGGVIIHYILGPEVCHIIGYQSNNKIIKNNTNLKIENPFELLIEYSKLLK